MADHSTPTTTPMQAETPEEFLADRERFWNGFTQFTLWSTVSLVILLILMAVFLL